MDNETKKYLRAGKKYMEKNMPQQYWEFRRSQNAAMKRYRERDRNTVLEYYGHTCACCGESQREFLQIDHIGNDGADHRKSIKRANIYTWLIKNGFPEGFQLLCANCNLSKGFYGYCPHWNEKEESNHE